MEALPIVGFALAVAVIGVVMAIRSNRHSRQVATGDSSGSYAWTSGDSGSSDCGPGSSGGDCGGGDGGGGGGD